jgi:hypothetical protein
VDTSVSEVRVDSTLRYRPEDKRKRQYLCRRMTVFWDVALCTLAEIVRRFYLHRPDYKSTKHL